ncbi:hypothetical protein JHJ32_00790 [Parapedobacter sp. ISTM3]|uniref:PEP-CTERM protein-sorting domain-containing protein n=1 Tax=Parapedobacter luteus TaxID=623280 RepID=A0A1T5DA06_9SPHI|nr:MULTISPECIES: hypothetical protein [Parapedobacter]MBK1438509.1 hypothetical protein [Parapedobacter sp. ISTM3]SKB68383.1 hypothetical protein SAMN05660226_02636 [Parapedobacter luteus]
MKKLQQIITHPYFSYVYLFVVVFCIICLLVLPQGHPLTTGAVAVGLALFVLHRYRKYLLRKQG